MVMDLWEHATEDDWVPVEWAALDEVMEELDNRGEDVAMRLSLRCLLVAMSESFIPGG